MLAAARLEFTAAGPRSLQFGDRYHAEIGPRAQAAEVFIAGCHLLQGWQGRDQFTVVETGFGLGFNFLSVWQAWRTDPQACRRLHFLSIEQYPVTPGDLARAHAAEPALAHCARELRRALPPPMAGVHRIDFEQGRVMLTLVYGDGAAALAGISASAEAVFLDGFAPSCNPALWSPAVLAQLGRLARPGARLATWCAAGEVRRQLANAGFATETAPGFGSKRETTRAVRLDSAAARGVAADARPVHDAGRAPGHRPDVAIIGAGLAGCHLAWRLGLRGWDVTLLDAAAGPGCAASGNPVGVVRPLFSRDDNPASRFTRAALLYARQVWPNAAHAGIRAAWHPSGVLQLARSAEQWAQWQAFLTVQALPGEYAWLMDTATARRRLGLPVAHGGLMFPLAGWAEPAALCRALLAAAGEGLVQRFGSEAARIEPDAGGIWRVVDAAGRPLARARNIVFANGAGPAGRRPDTLDAGYPSTRAPFLPARLRAPQTLRGEVTSVEGEALADLDLPVCSEGYVCPLPGGGFNLGATYDQDGGDRPTAAGVDENLGRLGLLSGLSGSAVTVRDGRAAWRSIASDRLPMVGRDPERAGWWHLRALASRGLVWSPLCAETLACEMSGEAMPLSTELRAIISLERHSIRTKPDHAAHHADRRRRQPAT